MPAVAGDHTAIGATRSAGPEMSEILRHYDSGSVLRELW